MERRAWAAPTAVLLTLVLVLFHLLVHRDERSWQAKGAIQDTLTFEGHLLEWEWVHVGETVHLFDGVAPQAARVSTQNLYRMLGAYVMSIARKTLGGIYGAALASTVIFWLVAAAAVYGLVKLASGSSGTAMLGAALAGTAPGFVGYLANVDPHPAGYVSVAAWLYAVERWEVLEPSPSPERRQFSDRSGPVAAGLTLCIASFALEIAYPLLLAVWVLYLARALRPGGSVVSTLLRLMLMTVVFGAGHFGFRLLAERVLLEQVIALNEPHAAVGATLTRIREGGLLAWITGHWPYQPQRWLAAFPPMVSVTALVGWFSVSSRWRWWATVVTASFVAAVLVTKPATRTLYLTYPAVYVLAACGMARLGQLAASRLSPATTTATSALSIHRQVQWTVAGALVAAAIVTTNADLWGDYSIPVRWYGSQ